MGYSTLPLVLATAVFTYIYAIIGHFRASFSRLYRRGLRGCSAFKTNLRKYVILVLEWRQKKSRKG